MSVSICVHPRNPTQIPMESVSRSPEVPRCPFPVCYFLSPSPKGNCYPDLCYVDEFYPFLSFLQMDTCSLSISVPGFCGAVCVGKISCMLCLAIVCSPLL